MNDALNINYGDIVTTIFLLGVPAILFFVFYRAFKLDKKKASERLKLEKENAVILQKRIDELNDRLAVVEKKLKEVE